MKTKPNPYEKKNSYLARVSKRGCKRSLKGDAGKIKAAGKVVQMLTGTALTGWRAMVLSLLIVTQLSLGNIILLWVGG